MIFHDERFHAREGCSGSLHLPDNVDTVSVFLDESSHGLYLPFYSSQSLIN
jgi:hypothetical protein